MRKIKEAVNHFTYVKYVADSKALKSNATKWLEEIEAHGKSLKPLHLYAKIGYAYDGNVRLEPLDQDLFANEDNFSLVAYLYSLIDFREEWPVLFRYASGLCCSSFFRVHGALESVVIYR